MEFPDQGGVLLQSFRPKMSVRLDPEPDTQPESRQWTPEPRNTPPQEDHIELRIQQLNNRRFLLLKMQHFTKKAENNDGGTSEEMTCEDRDKRCELEAIQKELEELLVKKEELEKQRLRSKFKTPHRGLYLLPPLQLPQENVTREQRVRTRLVEETPTSPGVPVDSLGQTSALTQCPSCQEVVFTETRSSMGEAMWMLCCLSSMMGCAAGCCLIPLFMDRLRDVHHQCPRCQAHIHTYNPL